MRCLGVEEAETAASSKPQVRLSASGGLLHDYSWKGSRGAVSANGYLTNNSKWTCDGQSYVVFWCVSWKPPIQRCPGQRKRVVVRSETFWWGELWWQKNRNLTFLSGWIFHPWTRIVFKFQFAFLVFEGFFFWGGTLFQEGLIHPDRGKVENQNFLLQLSRPTNSPWRPAFPPFKGCTYS